MPEVVNLKEFIHPGMDILFLALNAPEISNRNGHWFSRNLSFWNLLYDAGLITERIGDKLLGDVTIFGGRRINFQNQIYGVTDLNREVVQTRGDSVKINESQILRILMILDSNRVDKLCLMHAAVARAFAKFGIIRRKSNGVANGYGKVGGYKNTEIYEVPFHGASISGKETYYKLLAGVIPEYPKEASAFNTGTQQKVKRIIDFPKNSDTIFYLPDSGNEITEKDISNGVLRITVGASIWFPSTSQNVQITIKNVTTMVIFEKRNGRSDRLKIGRNLMSKLCLKSHGRLKFTRLKLNSFSIEKV